MTGVYWKLVKGYHPDKYDEFTELTEEEGNKAFKTKSKRL